MILIGEKKQLKANLHCHSTISDGRLSPEELKRIYKEQGYSVLSITDHDFPYDHSDLNDEDFLLLTGYEAGIRLSPEYKYDIYAPEIHINLFARNPANVTLVNFEPNSCKRLVKKPEYLASIPKVGVEGPRRYEADYVNEFVKTAKEAGYICSHNHPLWSLEELSAIYKYEGFFSMEICNYTSYVGNMLEYNAYLYDRLLSSGKRLFCHGSDDNHNVAPLGTRLSDSFGAFTVILADKLDYDSVFSALERGDFYASRGPVIKELSVEGNRAYIKTDKADRISMYYGAKHLSVKLDEDGNGIFDASFDIPDTAPYVRFSVWDKDGKTADTRGYFRDELGI